MTSELVLTALRPVRLGHMQVFAFSYGICAGIRGFLFSILSTRLMEQLRWDAAQLTLSTADDHLLCCRTAVVQDTLTPARFRTKFQATCSGACSGQVFDALVRQPVEFFDKVGWSDDCGCMAE